MDRIFHHDTKKFANNIYATRKGQIRLEILEQDLQIVLHSLKNKMQPLEEQESPVQVLDAGAGLGQVSQMFARERHQVIHLDGSEQMVKTAQQNHQIAGLTPYYQYRVQTIQSLSESKTQYEVILCHAVLEWLENPFEALQILNEKLALGGWLSLMFYNKKAKLMANMLFGNHDYVAADLKVKKKVRFSPKQPLEIEQVKSWLAQFPLELYRHSGVRCFNDYLKQSQMPLNEKQFFELEKKYARLEPFRSLGRYQHLLLRKVF